MTSSHAPGAPPRREALWAVSAFAVTLFVGRLLAAVYGKFIENDSTSLAAGIAAIYRGAGGDIYRYGPQVGYYQLLSWLTGLFGGDVLTIPMIQVTLSVVSGTLLPLMGLFAFRADLTRLERWLTALTLAASPVLWMSSRYGSSALVSVPLAVAGFVVLSNRPAILSEALALVLLAAAILVRADAVLVTPGVAILLWRNHGRIVPAAVRLLVLGAVVAASFALLFLFDPRTHEFAGDVARHLTNPSVTMFWEYLVWSVSPVALIFAVLGFRALVPERHWLFGSLAAWSLPVLGFYFSSTTQPRYFLLPMFALAIGTAVGMVNVVEAAGKRRHLARAAVVAACSVHLLVGLGRFTPGNRRSYLTEASVETHTGPLWTGAFLYKSYWTMGLSNATIRHPRWGRTNPGELAATEMFAYLSSGALRGRHVLVVYQPWFANVMHFYVQVAGARILSQGDGLPFHRRTEMELGGSRLTTISLLQQADSAVAFPVGEGDELWLVAKEDATSSLIEGRLPGGLAVSRDSLLFGAPLTYRFRVERGAGARPDGSRPRLTQ